MLNQVPTDIPLSQRAQAVIDALCAQGCRHVRDIIASLERGEDLPELQQLTAQERFGVLKELKSIMAVYDQPC